MQEKVRKAATRRGDDAAAAAEAVLRTPVTLPLPVTCTAAAAVLPPPPLPPPPPPPPPCTRSTITPLQQRYGVPDPSAWGPEGDEDYDPVALQDDPQVVAARAQLSEQWCGSREAAYAIAVVDQLEHYYDLIDEGLPVSEVNLELMTVRYKHALRALKATVPADVAHACDVLEPRMADESNSIPCPVGFGRLARWPWGLHLRSLGFCHPECRCDVLCRVRDLVVKTSLGEWPKDVPHAMPDGVEYVCIGSDTRPCRHDDDLNWHG